MQVNEIKKLVGSNFFSVVFTKKDGSERKMLCRLGVKKHLKGGTKLYNTDAMNYLTVYDMAKKGYRTVNLNTLKRIKVKGKEINL